MTAYSLELVEQDGVGGWNVVATIDKPVFTQPPTRVLNGIGSAVIQVSPNDPDHSAFYTALATDYFAREIRLRRASGDPWLWAVPMPQKPLGDPVLVVALADAIPWLLSGLHFGKAQRENLLDNPSFEDAPDLTGWTTTGVDTATKDSTQSVLDDHSAKLDNATAEEDASIQQSFSFTATPIGNIISVAGWFKIDSAGYVGPPFERRGLYIEWIQGGVVQDNAFYPIDDNTPRDEWVRAEIPLTQSIWIPPNETVTINVRGYCIGGVIRWDAMFVGVMESWSTGPGGFDLRDIITGITSHAQDPAYDKVDLDIPTTGAATGRVIPFHRQFAEHANVWTNGVMELVGHDDGIDVGSVLTAASRSLGVWSRVGAATGKGTDRTALDLSLGGDYVIDYGWSRQAGQGASSVTMLGPGDGPDREEGGYLNLAAFGNRAREVIVASPAEATIDDLDERARKIGSVRSRPWLLHLLFRPGVLVDTLDTGDRLTVPAYDAHVAAMGAPGTWRVTELALNPREDRLIATVNPA